MPNRNQTLDELLEIWENGIASGREPSLNELCRNSPELRGDLAQRIEHLRRTAWMVSPPRDDGSLGKTMSAGQEMPVSIPEEMSLEAFTSALVATGLVPTSELNATGAATARQLAARLIQTGRFTPYQIRQVASGSGRTLVIGNYLILDLIGTGGMGRVFKARHKRMDRVVALKTLPPEVAGATQANERFQQEVKAAAKLEHPNIVSTYDADEHNGTHFLVMQYCDGQDLASFVETNGPMNCGQALYCVAQAAKGLQYAHQQGIVHRDIKPANLMLDKRHAIKILDMGLARLLPSPVGNLANQNPKLTIDGAVMGTVDYMAPEQAMDAAAADERSDIYSLGCTLHFLLTGRPPYAGSSMLAKLMAHRDSAVPVLEDKVVNSVFQKMVCKQTEGRYQTVGELLVDLKRIYKQFAHAARFENQSAISKKPIPAKVETSSVQGAETVEHLRKEIPQSKPVSLRGTATKSFRGTTWFRGVVTVTAALLTLFGGYFLYDIIFRIETPGGIVQIESSHPDLDVFVDNEKIVFITDPNDNTKIRVEIPKGAKSLRVSKGGFEANVAEFNLKTVKGPIRVTFTPIVRPAEPFDESIRRTLATRVLETGGKLTINVQSQNEIAVDAVGTLPHEAFSIRALIFRGDSVDVALMELIGRVTELRELDLEAQSITDAHMKFLSSLSNLERLNIQKNGISDAGLEHLAELVRLKTLNLTGTGVTERGLAKLQLLQNLTYLTARNTNISKDGVDVFLTFRHLERLYLPQVANDEWLEELTALKNLRYLNAEGANEITADGVAKFRQVLPDCQIDWADPLKAAIAAEQQRVAKWVLSVGGRVYFDGTGSEQATTPDEVDQRVSDKPLYFHLAERGIRDEDLKQFADIPAIGILCLDGNPIDGTGLAYLTDKGSINLHVNSTNVNDAAMSAIAKIADGTTLISLSNTKITDLGLNEFYSLPTILTLASTAITDRGIATLSRIKNATKELDLSNTAITDACIDDLIRFPSLTNLWIFDTEITHEGSLKLHAGLPNCNIRDNDRKAAEWVMSAQGQLGLTTTDGKVDASMPEQIPIQPFTIWKVNLSNTKFNDAGLAELSRLRHLSHIDLSNTQIGDAGLQRLASLTLRVLRLKGCANVTSDDIAKLREALPACEIEWDDPLP